MRTIRHSASLRNGIAIAFLGVPFLFSHDCEAQVRKSGAEFQANTFTEFFQIQPRVETLDSERFVVVWHGSSPVPAESYGVRGQMFDRTAAPEGAEFLVSSSAALDDYSEENPAISRSGLGGFVVAWQGYVYGEDNLISAQRYDSEGLQVGEVLPVSSTAQGGAYPTIAADTAGNLIVAWVWTPHIGETAEIRARKFNAIGTPTTEEFMIADASSFAWVPSIGMLPDGGFVVVWQDSGGVLGRRFDELGQATGAAFVVSPVGSRPEVATTQAGSFVVVWQQDGPDGDGLGVFGRRYASDTKADGEWFQINSYTADQQEFPSVATNTDGGFVVVWESYVDFFDDDNGQDGSGRGIFGQAFKPDGQPLGREFQVNSFVAGNQGTGLGRNSDLAMWPDGSFVVTWTSEEQDGDYAGVFGQVFTLDPSLGALCGDAANSDLIVSSRDALAILRGAVGLHVCEECLCDVDASGDVAASDALLSLRAAVGLGQRMSCPPEC